MGRPIHKLLLTPLPHYYYYLNIIKTSYISKIDFTEPMSIYMEEA